MYSERERKTKNQASQKEKKMKAYKLNIWVYNFRNGGYNPFENEEKFFLKREDAEKWAKENPTYAHEEGKDTTEKEYRMPMFEIEEIEIN